RRRPAALPGRGHGRAPVQAAEARTARPGGVDVGASAHGGQAPGVSAARRELRAYLKGQVLSRVRASGMSMPFSHVGCALGRITFTSYVPAGTTRSRSGPSARALPISVAGTPGGV